MGRKIGEGGCSEIFEWDGAGKILKLAKANTIRSAAVREHRNSRLAWAAGFAAPETFEFVDIDGRPGIVFARIDGETLLSRFSADAAAWSPTGGERRGLARTEYDVRTTARILSAIHAVPAAEELPDQRDAIRGNIWSAGQLSESEKEAVIAHLDRLPARRQWCHGDPNPNNVLMQDGRAVMIDWMNASCGNPEADLAEYVLMIRFAVLPEGTPEATARYFAAVREWMIEVFLDEYEQRASIRREQIEPWLAPIAARKLAADAISEAEKRLLVAEVRRRIAGWNAPSAS